MANNIVIPGYNPGNRVPGVYFALDNARANTASATRRVLLIGQMLTDSPGIAGTAIFASSISAAVAAYGDGSQIVRLLRAYRQIDSSGEVWLLPLADEAGAAKASGTLTLTGTATQAGTLPIYIDDQLITVGVSIGDTAQTVAANIVTACSALNSLPVTAAAGTSSTAAVTFTAKNAGLCGNDILLNVALRGSSDGEVIPAGLTATTAPMTGGAQNPQLPNVLAAQGNRIYDIFAHPYTDSAALSAFAEWTDNVTGRWSPMRQLYGQGITAMRGTYGQLAALKLKNDPHQSVMGISDSPSSPVAWAAWVAGRVAMTMRINPALPITELSLPAMPPSDGGIFDLDERNLLLHDGISTFLTGDDGSVYIERIITTYRQTPEGEADDSYLDIERLLTAQICLQDLSSYLATQVGGSILLQNGAKIPAGARATTPDLIKRTIAARYRYQCDQLWCQNPDYFSANVVVNYAGEGVVTAQLPYQFADQLWVIAGDCQFLAAS